MRDTLTTITDVSGIGLTTTVDMWVQNSGTWTYANTTTGVRSRTIIIPGTPDNAIDILKFDGAGDSPNSVKPVSGARCDVRDAYPPHGDAAGAWEVSHEIDSDRSLPEARRC